MGGPLSDCGDENEGPVNAGPGKCPTWNTNNDFNIYACITNTGSRTYYMWVSDAINIEVTHKDDVNHSAHAYCQFFVVMKSDTYEKVPKGRAFVYIHDNHLSYNERPVHVPQVNTRLLD